MTLIQSRQTGRDVPLLLRSVDYCLVATVAIAPLAMGGRHPLGHLIFVALAVAAALAWFMYQARMSSPIWTQSPMEMLFAAGVGVVLLQLVCWPESVSGWIAPSSNMLVSLADNGPGINGPGMSGFERWARISLAPTATRRGLVLLLAYGLLFFTTLQRLRDVSDIEWLLKWMAIAAVSMATLGIVQYLTSNGKFLWIYAHPFRDTNDVVKGPFINRNHFAHFLAMGVPPLMWWVANIAKRSAPAVPGDGFSTTTSIDALPFWHLLGLGVVLLAGLLSLSRGGVGAMVAASAICAALLYRAGLLNKRLVWAVVALGGLLIAALAIHGAQGVLNRLAEVTSGSLDKLDRDASRRQIWQADLQALRQYPLFGTGVGSHSVVYPTFLPHASDTLEYTHAESGYVHVALETGVVGLAIVLLVIAFCGRCCWQVLRWAESRTHRACSAAISASLAVSALHSLVDFVWFIPACMAVTVMMAACGYRLSLLVRGAEAAQHERVVSTTSVRWATLIVLVLGSWMLAETMGPALGAPAWDRYLRLAAATAKAERISADDPKHDQPTRELERRRALEAMVAELEAVLKHDPRHLMAHVRLAAVRLRLFDALQDESPSTMPLAAVRDAAFQSRFASRQQLDQWLDRAIGPNAHHLEQARIHARRALALSPLVGEAYLYLKDLCFLEGADPAKKSIYLAQALKVRPFDGEIHFQAGKESFLDGNPELAIDHWRQAYDCDQEHRIRLIDLFTKELSSEVPVNFILEQFDPDLDGLRRLRVRYRELRLPEQWRTLLEYSAKRVTERAESTSDAQACALWLEAETLYRDQDNAECRIWCIDKALASDANNYSVHHAAAMCFYQTRQYESAEEQVKWCLSRAPNDKDLKRIRDQIVKERVEKVQSTSRTSSNQRSTR